VNEPKIYQIFIFILSSIKTIQFKLLQMVTEADPVLETSPAPFPQIEGEAIAPLPPTGSAPGIITQSKPTTSFAVFP